MTTQIREPSVALSRPLLHWNSRGIALAVTLGLLSLLNEVGSLMAIPFYGPMTTSLHLSAGQVSWALPATLLAGGATMPLLSKIGDLYGHRSFNSAKWTQATDGESGTTTDE